MLQSRHGSAVVNLGGKEKMDLCDPVLLNVARCCYLFLTASSKSRHFNALIF